METNLNAAPLKQRSKWVFIGLWTKQYLTKFSVAFFWRQFFLINIGLALIYLAVNLFFAWQWIDRPFAGFLHQNRIITYSSLPGWEIREAKIGAVPLTEGDLILTVDDKPLPSSQWLINHLNQTQQGHPVNYSLLKANGEIVNVQFATTQFTSQNFIQLVAIPVFIAFITLLIAGVATYLRSNFLSVKLFTLFSLALTYHLTSFPEFITSNLFYVNFTLAYVGKIIMPLVLLHFLLLFRRLRNIFKEWPFLFPLIYLPALPAFVHIPVLFSLPETTQNFNTIINAYTALYTFIGLGLLADLTFRANTPRVRKQSLVLFLGLILPTLMLFGLVWNSNAINYTFASAILERYIFIGFPIAIAIAVLRHQLFGIQPANRSYLFYIKAMMIALFGVFVLFLLISPNLINFNQSYSQDLRTILFVTTGFFLTRFLYHLTYRWWMENHFYSTIDDFRIGFRIFSGEMLKVKSRRDLEGLISWELASDFRLRSAELVPADKPTIPYALLLSLAINNVSLGTLFLGAKIDGNNFSNEEMDVLADLQKQLALALWSLELDKAIQATEQLTRLKSKFLANVTHELRAPLNGIINYIGFVLDDHQDVLNREQIDYLTQALAGAEKLLQIINNILDMSKIEVGQMTLNRQSTDLREVVAETLEFVTEMITDKQIEFVTDVSPALPTLHGDRLRLRQIILNVLSNAAKFTKTGSIHLNAYPDNGNVVIQIEDTGIGIDEKTLPTIFQHFISGSLTDKNQLYGPGLSMPITKSLVELHGGRVDVESDPGQGTKFTITLPVKSTE